MPDRSRTAPIAARFARIVVAVLLTWVAFAWSGLSLGELGAGLRGASASWLAAAVGLVLVDRAVMAWRWVTLLRATGSGGSLRLGAVMRIFFISSFAGTFMPAAGDTMRAVSVARLDVTGGDALGSVVVDRLLGLLSMLTVGLAGLVLALVLPGPIVERRVLGVALVVTAVAAAGAALLLFDSRILGGLIRLVGGGRFPTAERLSGKALDGIRQFGRAKGVLASVFVASVAIQLLRTLQAWCLGLAVGLSVKGVFYVAFVPLITLIMQLPITVSGLGTSQLAFKYFFEQAGGAPDVAVLVSVLYVALGWIGILPGGLLLMVGPIAPEGTRTRERP